MSNYKQVCGSILTETFINILNQLHKRKLIQEPIKIRNNN